MLKIIGPILLVLLFSCSGDEKPTPVKLVSKVEKKQETKTPVVKPIKVAPKKELINNQNVREKLTEYGKLNPETKVQINTKHGKIRIRLYEDTPLHRANFILLTKEKYFDSTLFYRVIYNFMIQGGNSDRDDVAYKMSNIGNYQVPEEIKSHHYHKRGAIAMAVSEQNDTPEDKKHKNSSPYNFYIVEQNPISDKHMDKLEDHYHIKINEKRRRTYRKYGGVPHLDDDYTVFGEVYSGMSVVEKIASLSTDAYDRPLENLKISVEVIK